MAKKRKASTRTQSAYVAVVGIDHDGRRFEPGEKLPDLGKAEAWLIECGAIAPAGDYEPEPEPEAPSTGSSSSTLAGEPESSSTDESSDTSSDGTSDEDEES